MDYNIVIGECGKGFRMFIYRERLNKHFWWLLPTLMTCMYLPLLIRNWPYGLTLVLTIFAIQLPVLLRRVTLYQDRIVFSALFSKTLYYQKIEHIELDPVQFRLTFKMSDGRDEYRFFNKNELDEGLDDLRTYLRTLIAYAKASNGSIVVASQTTAFLDDESAEYKSLIHRNRQHPITIGRILGFLFCFLVSISFEIFSYLFYFSHSAITIQTYAGNGWAVLAIVLLAMTLLAKAGLWATFSLLKTKWEPFVMRACPIFLIARITATALLCLTIALFSSVEDSGGKMYIVTKFASYAAVEALCAFVVLKLKIGRTKAVYNPID